MRALACGARQLVKIDTIVLPLPYNQLLKLFLLGWNFSLPFVISEECGWFLPFIMFVGLFRILSALGGSNPNARGPRPGSSSHRPSSGSTRWARCSSSPSASRRPTSRCSRLARRCKDDGSKRGTCGCTTLGTPLPTGPPAPHTVQVADDLDGMLLTADRAARRAAAALDEAEKAGRAKPAAAEQPMPAATRLQPLPAIKPIQLEVQDDGGVGGVSGVGGVGQGGGDGQGGGFGSTGLGGAFDEDGMDDD